jgi:hypothetical protein
VTLRWWYLRRGVAWQPLLGCCAVATAAAGVVARWPSTALLLLPALLACCAAGSAFVFDEPSASVVAVTPRGATWRRTARLAVTALPLTLWAAVVALRPGGVPLVRPGWWLVGAATILLASGVAALSSRREASAPGAALAAALVIAVIGPVLAAGFLGLASPYPIDGFPDGVRGLWLGVAAAACLAWCIALRPGLGR